MKLSGLGIIPFLIFLGCNASNTNPGTLGSSGITQEFIPASEGSGPQNPRNPLQTRSFTTDVLLFNGAGTWTEEVQSLIKILSDHSASYQLINSNQLNTMSVADFIKYGTILFPGGSGGTQAGSLTSDTRARIREAVQIYGLNYIGFCAGAFIAVAPAPSPGQDVSYGLGVVNGPILDYYYLENQGVGTAMTLTTFPDGSKRDLLWYGGPVTPSAKGQVIAKYPTGEAAISQLWSGKGLVIISGPHPAATQATRESFRLNDTDGVDFDLTWQLIEAAIHQRTLPTF